MVRSSPPRTRRRFGNAWDELSYVCRKTHYWWHVRRHKANAKRYLRRLARLLKNLPRDDEGGAIIRAEGNALVHEISENLELAIQFRRREIELMEKLHGIVEAESYLKDMRDSVLVDRGVGELNVRRAILRRLQRRLSR